MPITQYSVKKNQSLIYFCSAFFIVFLPFLCVTFSGFSQILDDSTQQIYNIKTVVFFYEEDVLNNRKTVYNPDTTLENFHLFDFKLRSGNLYQDLGNFGTATKSVFYNPPTQIGRQLGISVFSPYAFDATRVQYFNTKSPYTNMNYIQANRGSSRLHFTHSQNITPQWNATFDVRRQSASKQYGSPQTREDRTLDSYAFMIHSNYESKNKRYVLLGNYNHFNHKSFELGGMLPADKKQKYIPDDELGNETAFKQTASYLTGAVAREIWNDTHIYQQYKLSNGVQLFHVFDRQKHKNFYKDSQFRTDSTSLKYYFIENGNLSSTDTLKQYLTYNLVENKFGVKGIYRGFAYRLHLRSRFYNLNDNIDEKGSIKLKNETIAGGWANYYFPDSLRRAFAEVEIGSGLDYSIKAEYISPDLKVGFNQISYQPSLIDGLFQSSALKWETNLKNVFSNNFYGNFILQTKNFILKPSGSYSLIKNFIYYDNEAKVAQTSLPAHILRVGLGIEYRIKRFLIANETYFTSNSRKDFIRIPTLVNNTKIGIEFIYAKVLHVSTGVEVYYRSAYKGDNYMPLTRQFFLQDVQNIWGKPSADVFADMKINRVRLFFKYANLPYGFTPNGYYVSSTYPALRNTFIMGVNWPLFD